MQTSYYARYKGENGVSISRYKPKWWDGPSYLDLAPPASLVRAYKAGELTDAEYARLYKRQVLAHLDPAKVYEDLKDKVLLCYEKPGDLCHRHIVRAWFKHYLGIEVTEYEKPVTN